MGAFSKADAVYLNFDMVQPASLLTRYDTLRGDILTAMREWVDNNGVKNDKHAHHTSKEYDFAENGTTPVITLTGDPVRQVSIQLIALNEGPLTFFIEDNNSGESDSYDELAFQGEAGVCLMSLWEEMRNMSPV